ncbi:uncharacterized protein LOC111699477 [Eurytemora carolleeae]|uniref:uncharacterized protein LOC111699477 n=1 Tax=Eurytemora carolleeae TaxID=1294199 RepID=UPI000C786A3E|nr:uncharacterized protein LOC111699477 [Eurytemora carolleeae]|eukprot:XP_023325939.1 uncharacterized protein LOC111699477 [Eurytemora affinis]
MDMDEYFEAMSKRPVSAGIGNMLTQIVLCNTGRPDFNIEEIASVEKDKRELGNIVDDIADHLPREDPTKAIDGLTSEEQDRRKWRIRRKRRKPLIHCCFCTL